MEKELNYLKEKVEEIQIDIDYNTRESAASEDYDDRFWYSELIEMAETEKECLNNLIDFVGKHCLEI